jgi:hypothetical protein
MIIRMRRKCNILFGIIRMYRGSIPGIKPERTGTHMSQKCGIRFGNIRMLKGGTEGSG